MRTRETIHLGNVDKSNDDIIKIPSDERNDNIQKIHAEKRNNDIRDMWTRAMMTL